MSARPVVIMAGGTGGHVYPALAVARELAAREVPVVWIGTRAGLEARVVPAAGIPVHWLRVTGLRGKGTLSLLLAPVRLLLALAQALRILFRLRPRAVLGMGGFVSGPGGLGARLLHLPLVVHEQNAVAGLTNRILARLADTVLCGFPDCLAGRTGATFVGNPVRAEIAALAPPEERMADRPGPVRLLVVGGSQGALALNRLVPEALARLAGTPPLEVRHQAGERTLETAREAYRRAGVAGRVEPFIEDMAEAYGWSDLVVCRAGALTVAELAAAGVASVLVPYPHAVDDHQRVNGEYLVRAGAAVLLSQAGLDAAVLADTLRALAADPQRLRAMAGAARTLARPHAARDVADACLNVGVAA